MKALCCILNYNCNENANYLYNEFNKYCEAHVIDSNSNNPYPYFENVGNYYYTNLFNHAIRKFNNGDYTNLIIITSDIIISKEAIEYTSNFANGELGKIGIWSLQTDKLSRDHFNPYDENKHDSYVTMFIEGFFQVMNKVVVKKHKYIPLEINKIGVCIDQYSAAICAKLNKYLVIDRHFTIHHPQEKGYDYNEAHSYDCQFFKWVIQQINQI